MLSNGSGSSAKHEIDGGPSGLFDAVAIIPSVEGAALLVSDKPLAFGSDAFAHCEFIGMTEGGRSLLEAAGLGEKLDEGCLLLAKSADASEFHKACAPLRLWNWQSIWMSDRLAGCCGANRGQSTEPPPRLLAPPIRSTEPFEVPGRLASLE